MIELTVLLAVFLSGVTAGILLLVRLADFQRAANCVPCRRLGGGCSPPADRPARRVAPSWRPA
jgi:hypothetical protein